MWMNLVAIIITRDQLQLNDSSTVDPKEGTWENIYDQIKAAGQSLTRQIADNCLASPD